MIRVPVLIATVILAYVSYSNSQGPQFIPAPGSPIIVGEGSGKMLLADINGDGRLDLVAAHLQKHFVSLQIGDGTGRFAAAPGSPIRLDYPPGDIKLADLNGDKLIDLGVANSNRDSVDIFSGNGKGSFSRAAGSPFVASESTEFYTRSLFVIDINEDGEPDLATLNHRSNSFSLLIGDGRGGFAKAPAVKFHSDQARYSFAFGDYFADIDGDGHLDILAVCDESSETLESGRVNWLRGNGKGAFAESPGTSFRLPSKPRFVRLADLNGDQRLDIAISFGVNQVAVFLNGGNGTFAAPSSPYSVGEVFALAVVDVNRDGRGDLIAATVDSVTVLVSAGNRFAPAPGSPFRAGPGAYHLAVGDINADGKMDIVANSFEGNAVTVLLGR